MIALIPQPLPTKLDVQPDNLRLFERYDNISEGIFGIAADGLDGSTRLTAPFSSKCQLLRESRPPAPREFVFTIRDSRQTLAASLSLRFVVGSRKISSVPAEQIESQATFFAARRLRAVFLTVEAARFTAHLRFIASASRRRPSSVIPLLRGAAFVETVGVEVSAALFKAQCFFCARERRFLRLRVAGSAMAGDDAGAADSIPSTSLNAASASSIAVFWRSN